MLGYHLRMAVLSLRRNPYLTLLLVAGIALGIGVSTTFVTAMYTFAGHPIPHKEGTLFYVEVDAWDPQRPYDDDHPERPPDQMTWMDVMAAQKSDIPIHSAGMYKSMLTVHPESKEMRPYRAETRLTHGGFFDLFDVPFAHGSGWGEKADAGPEPVVVLSDETNQKLFGGENSVGRTVRLEERDFTIVGVMAPWRPVPKYYDPHNGAADETEKLYIPILWAEPMEIISSGNTSGWKRYDGEEFKDFLASENIWLQMWVELKDQKDREAYQAFLDAYALEQKKLGRFQRPLNNRLLPVSRWLEEEEVVPQEARSMLIIGLLFLLVCSVNLIGILLSKFLARAPEVSVRRALGASRLRVFLQHLMECEIVGVIGGLAGIGLTFVGVRLIENLFDTTFSFPVDLTMMGVAVALSLASALVAGLYPAWRICRIQPAAYLKTQ